MTENIPVCLTCKHFNEFEGGCKAFPGGIPIVVSSGESQHTEPLPGQDNTLVYEPVED